MDVQIEEVMEHLESWEHFNVFEVAKLVRGHVLATVVYYSLERYNLLEKLDISEEKLYNFLVVRIDFRDRQFNDSVGYERRHLQDILSGHVGDREPIPIQFLSQRNARG
jgi:hypothetical protein